MRNIKKILEKIIADIPNEEYKSSLKSGFASNDNKLVDVFENSDSLELAKLIKKHNVLRFVVNKKGNYIVWDGMAAIHGQVMKNLKDEYGVLKDSFIGQIVSKEPDSDLMWIIKGFKGIYIYKDEIMNHGQGYKRIEDKFKKTKLYANLEKIGLSNVVAGKNL